MRNKLIHLTRVAALLGIIGAPCLQAQDSDYGPYKFDVKTRFAMYTGEMRDLNQQNRAYGFGVQARRELFGPNSAISLEVTWEHVPAMHHDVIDYAKHGNYATDGGVHTDRSKGILNLSPWWSFDDRKAEARGFSVLLGYYSKFPTFGSELLDEITGRMEWFAGLRFDRFNVLSEFRWQLMNMDGIEMPPWGGNVSPGSNNPPPFYDSVNGAGQGSYGAFTEEGAAIVPGFFAGIKYTYTDIVAFEFGMRYFGRKNWNFTPVTFLPDDTLVTNNQTPKKYVLNATTKGGELTTGTTSGYGLEFALIWKL